MGLLDSIVGRRSNDDASDQVITKSAEHIKPPAAPQVVSIPSRPVAPGGYLARLNEPMVRLSPAGDMWRIEDATAGVSILGSNGSGKTTGSGQTLAKAYLRAGWGGLVLCAKADEADLWERYAHETGRSKDVIRVGREHLWRFNFLYYELNRPGDSAARVDNLISTLMNLMEQQGRNSVGGDAAQWQQMAENLLRNSLMMLTAAQSYFTLFEVQQFIDSVPLSEDAAKRSGETPFAKTLERAKAAYISERRLADYDIIEHYFKVQFPRLADRTRSSITITLDSMMQDLLTGLPREMFGTGTNFFPEDSFEGAIILLDLPVIENRANRTAQSLFKTVWQQAALRRQGGDLQRMRPTFLWADEAHFFVTQYDTSYQSLARSAKACTVYLTQNLSSYEAELGERGEVLARRLMGLFQTHIFHAQTDPHTLNYIIQLFGRREVTRINRTVNRSVGSSYSFNMSVNSSVSGGDYQPGSHSAGYSTGENFGQSETLSHGGSESTQVEDSLFASNLTTLPNGSDRYGGIAAAFIFKNANTWQHGNNILYSQFTRRLK